MSNPRPRAAAVRAVWMLCAVLSGALILPGATCSTGNPGTVFDPGNPGGGGGGGGGKPPPKDPGPHAAPVAGALLLAGRPSLTASAPAANAGQVDVLAPVALWFSESLQPLTLTAQNLVIRPEGVGSVGGAQVSFSATWLAGNRCAVLQPTLPLAPNTRYEVVANDELLDLDGARLRVPANGVLFTFKTASQAAGLAPRVLGSFPPAGAVQQANDHPAILVFSKPMDFTGISGAVKLLNLDTSADAAYDKSAAAEFRHAGNRVFEFPHTDDASDLGANLRLRVDTSITDADFFPHPLQNAYSATWSSLAFARPAGIAAVDPDPADPFAPAVNGANFDDFQVDVFLDSSALASDSAVLSANDASGPKFVQNTRKASSGTLRFHLDLGDPDAPGTLFGSTGRVVLAAFNARGDLRSTVQVARDAAGEPTTVPVDTVAPSLLSFGPPSGQFGSQFVADVPELRTYGDATEPVGRVRVRFPASGPASERDAFAPAADGFFVGPAFDLGAVSAAPFPFDVLLTDTAGNEAAFPVVASAVFRGFVGPQPLTTGVVRVAAYDLATLFPISGAKVYIENLGGGSESFGFTGSDGIVNFPSRSGRQTVTVIAEGRQSVTVYGAGATELSLNLPLTSDPVASLSPGISGVSTGVTTVSGSLLANADGLADADLLQTVDLDQLFGSGITARLQRLGWYAAFHDVQGFPSAGSYFRFFALEPQILLQPSLGSAVQSPTLALRESTNALLSTTDYQYPLTVTVAGGFNLPVASAGAVGFARIPGLDHLAAIGAGAVSGSSGKLEIELELYGAAVAEGAPGNQVIVQVHATDNQGDFALARKTVALAAAPGTVALTLPGIPEANAAWTGASYPFTRSFTASLAAGDGYYRIIIRDNEPIPNSWQIWVPASVGVSGSVTLPTLRESPTAAVGAPPLASQPGASWRAFVESYDMPAGFQELGCFFSSLRRDCDGFARTVNGPAKAF